MKIKTFLTALLLGSATLATAAPTTMQFDEPVYTHSSHAKQRYSGQTRDIMGFLDEKPIGKIGEIRQNGTVHISLPALRDDQLNPNIRLITAKNGKVVFMETPPEAAAESKPEEGGLGGTLTTEPALSLYKNDNDLLVLIYLNKAFEDPFFGKFNAGWSLANSSTHRFIADTKGYMGVD